MSEDAPHHAALCGAVNECTSDTCNNSQEAEICRICRVSWVFVHFLWDDAMSGGRGV